MGVLCYGARVVGDPYAWKLFLRVAGLIYRIFTWLLFCILLLFRCSPRRTLLSSWHCWVFNYFLFGHLFRYLFFKCRPLLHRFHLFFAEWLLARLSQQHSLPCWLLLILGSQNGWDPSHIGAKHGLIFNFFGRWGGRGARLYRLWWLDLTRGDREVRFSYLSHLYS